MLDIKSYFDQYKPNKELVQKTVLSKEDKALNIKMILDLSKYQLQIIDLDFNDEITNYALSTIREVYEKYISEIKEKYYQKMPYHFLQSERIHHLIEEKYSLKAEFLFSDYPDLGIYRNKSGKWFSAIMNTKYESFGIQRKGNIDVINLKSDKVEERIKTPGIYKAWHMSKKYWISVFLNDTIKDDQIMELIQESYELTK